MKERRPREDLRKEAIVQLALRWFARASRDQSWRNAKDPYAVWVSEVMLQQTQLLRAKVYYERFIKRFPKIGELSKATWRELLPLWRGLGYYGRARNLLATAKIVEKKHKGKFPSEKDSLLALPGIGPYTANAILSFAFAKPVPALDTNLYRVLGRVFGISKKSVPSVAGDLFARRPKRSADLNYAFMDIGATICKPKNPLCHSCPLNRECRYFLKRKKSALADSLPAAKRKKIDVHVTAACIHRDGRYLVAKRAKKKGGAWEFPGGKKEPGEDIRHCLKREIKEELGIEISVRPPFHTFDFRKENRAYRLHFSRCQILKGSPKPKEHEKIAWYRADELLTLGLAETNRSAAKGLLRFERKS